MGDAFIARSGSVGGLTVNAAVIHVNAPFGSTVEFTKDGVTAKTISPTYGHPNANDNGETADYYYAVFSGNYGTWTVSAHDEYFTTSNTVVVDNNIQYDVVLSFSIQLYHNGVKSSNLVASNVYASSTQSLTIDGTDLVAYGSFGGQGSNNGVFYFGTNSLVNLFHRTKIRFTLGRMRLVRRSGGTDTAIIGLLAAKPVNQKNPTWLVSTTLINTDLPRTYDIDISSYGETNTSYAVGIVGSAGSSENIWLYIQDWVVL